jgi:hypothetical protein
MPHRVIFLRIQIPRPVAQIRQLPASPIAEIRDMIARPVKSLRNPIPRVARYIPGLIQEANARLQHCLQQIASTIPHDFNSLWVNFFQMLFRLVAIQGWKDQQKTLLCIERAFRQRL